MSFSTIATVIAVLVLAVGVPLNWYVLRILRTLYRERPNPVLRERTITERLIIVTAVVFGVIFLFNDGFLPIPFLNSDLSKIVTRSIILALVTIPATYWLRLYR